MTRPRRLRALAAAALAASALGLAGCTGADEATVAVGNAICRDTNRQLAALGTASKADRDKVAVQMLVIHLREAGALGRLPDERVKILAAIQEQVAKFVRTSISGAPTQLEMPEGWEDSLHAGFAEVGLTDCALRGAEYPGTFGNGSVPGTPVPEGAKPPVALGEGSYEAPDSGPVFEVPEAETQELPGAPAAPGSSEAGAAPEASATTTQTPGTP